MEKSKISYESGIPTAAAPDLTHAEEVPPAAVPAHNNHLSHYMPSLYNSHPKKTVDFTNKSLRRRFVQKVYGILIAQLVLAMALIALANYQLDVRSFLRENPYTMTIPFAIVAVIILIIFRAKQDLGRKVPWNFMLQILLTISLAVTVAVLSTFLEPHQALCATGIVLFSVVCLALFTFQSKIAITCCRSFSISVVALTVISLIFWFSIPPKEPATLLIPIAAAVILGIYITCITEHMSSPSSSYYWKKISPEDYVLAAALIYTLIIFALVIMILVILALVVGEGDCGNCGGSGSPTAVDGCFCFCWESRRRPRRMENRDEEEAEEGQDLE